MSKNNKLHAIKFAATLVFLGFFIFVIAYANKFGQGQETIYVNPIFVQEGDGDIDYMNIDNISIEIGETNEGIIKYVVQAGDSLGKIANRFGVTISHLQKTNNIRSGSSIRPNQVIIITTHEEGMMYQMKDTMNVRIFADKYDLDIEDLMNLNYIQDETEILQKGQEIFINISREKSYDAGLIERPKPVYKPKKKVAYRPVVQKTSTSTASSSAGGTRIPTSTGRTSSKIISKRTFNKNINNGFYKGHCTWYMAVSTPSMFPYTSDTQQKRPFGGNANQWYANAQKAGYKVGQTPVGGAIAVYQMGGRNYSSAGHVAKVISYTPGGDTMIMEDMNYAGKFIVTRRVESIHNSNIKGYIYP